MTTQEQLEKALPLYKKEILKSLAKMIIMIEKDEFEDATELSAITNVQLVGLVTLDGIITNKFAGI